MSAQHGSWFSHRCSRSCHRCRQWWGCCCFMSVSQLLPHAHLWEFSTAGKERPEFNNRERARIFGWPRTLHIPVSWSWCPRAGHQTSWAQQRYAGHLEPSWRLWWDRCYRRWSEAQMWTHWMHPIGLPCHQSNGQQVVAPSVEQVEVLVIINKLWCV